MSQTEVYIWVTSSEKVNSTRSTVLSSYICWPTYVDLHLSTCICCQPNYVDLVTSPCNVNSNESIYLSAIFCQVNSPGIIKFQQDNMFNAVSLGAVLNNTAELFPTPSFCKLTINYYLLSLLLLFFKIGTKMETKMRNLFRITVRFGRCILVKSMTNL